jgi:2-C-methyl-D-erythritol 4-phosphate cytidylyltransferase
MNYLIIAAGGSGERMMSEDNKIFLKIKNKEIIYWTLKSFEENPTVDSIIISARVNDQERIRDIIEINNIKKVMAVVSAGESRQETVLNALEWLKTKAKEDDLIGIHNAANPFVLSKEIKDVFAAAKEHRAALLVHPARDTVKITNENNLVVDTPMRKTCWYAQTPQVAFYNDLLAAFAAAQNKNFVGTDDTQLLEMIGIKPKVVPCSRYNFKITFPEDLILAEKLLPIFVKENKLCSE